MKIIVLGAGHVGRTLVDALHTEHDVTVIDVDRSRLDAFADAFDVRTVHGDGATRRVVQQAGVAHADLFLACSPREGANLVCALLVKRLSSARTVVRTTSVELLEAWRAGEIEVDFMISPELETANAITGVVGLPTARQTDSFADGKVLVVEFDVPSNVGSNEVVGPALREARTPADSRVAAIVRGGEIIVPSGGEQIMPGDRVIVIASPQAARRWSHALAHEDRGIDDVIVFGAGQMGTTIATVLMQRGIRVRLVDGNPQRAQDVARELPDARVFHASAFDGAFLDRQRISQAAAVFCMNDDARSLYGAVLAKHHGARLTVALMHDATSREVYERAGVDVGINPREITAEEMVRFAHDPRVQQIAMLEGDRCEILDIAVRPESELANCAMRDLPISSSVVGALIRDGEAIFPHRDDVLRPGDRIILFVESANAWEAERAL